MAHTAHDSVDDQIRRMTPISAPRRQEADVKRLSSLLEHGSRRPRNSTYRVVGPRGDEALLPDSVLALLERVTEVLARGDAITIVPVGKELTTQQSADLLNVSRQYLVRLLDEGRIPHTKTGKHRRVRIEDVLAFKEKREGERAAALRELTELTEEIGGYDSELK